MFGAISFTEHLNLQYQTFYGTTAARLLYFARKGSAVTVTAVTFFK